MISKKSLLGWVMGMVVTGGMVAGVQAAAFKNLDFESANVTPQSYGTWVPVNTASALPSWTISYSNPTITTPSTMRVGIYYLDYTEVALMGPGASTLQYSYDIIQIQNNFMVHFGAINNPNGGIAQTVAISQFGTIPVGTQSIRYFLGQPNYAEYQPYSGIYPDFNAIELLINGTPIPTVTLSGSNDIWSIGADVSAYAGQNVELRFQSSAVNKPAWAEYSAYLDAISFSTVPVPEPSSVGLLVLGAMGLGVRRGKRA